MGEFLELVTLFRNVWIAGRLGFGKTALAVYIARRLLEMQLVDGVITNFPSILPAHYDKDDGTMYNRAIIFDEAWMFLDARSSMTNDTAYSAFARKINAYWIFPSVHPIDKRLRSVKCSPVSRSVLSGVTKWRYEVADDPKNPTQGFFSFNPKDIYGWYSTSYIPTDDCGIKERFEITYELETGQSYGKIDANKKARQDKELAMALLIGAE